MRVGLVIVAITAACGRIGFDPAGDGSGVPTAIQVGPAYPNAGANWNDYVAADGADPFSASDMPCDPAATPYSACLHGGELRMVAVTGATSCAGLTMTDALGAFAWTCVANGDGVAFYSTLAPGKGLRDLVAPSGWLADSVTLAGSTPLTTEPTTWWTNPVAALPDNSIAGSGVISLADASTVYVLDASRASDGYAIGAAKISFVTLAGATLTWNIGPANSIVVDSNGNDEVWIEANVAAGTAYNGIRVAAARFAQIYGTKVTGGGANPPHGAAILLEGSASSRVREVTSLDAGGSGIEIGAAATSDGNYFAELAVASASDNGVYIHFGAHDVLEGVVSSDNGGDGIAVGSYCDGGGLIGYHTLARVRASSNGGAGVFINSPGVTVLRSIAANNGQSGFAMDNACGDSWGAVLADDVGAFNATGAFALGDHNATFNNLVAIGDATYGVSDSGTSTWSNVAASDSVMGDVNLTGDSTFAAALLVSNNNACANVGGFNGLTAPTCVPSGTSSATLTYQGSLLGEFVGAATDDIVNHSQSAGTALYPVGGMMFDWLSFEDAYRVWGVWQGSGAWRNGTGQILDFRLLASGAKIFSNTGNVNMQNDPFVPGATCPTAVGGGIGVTNNNAGYMGFPTETYLTNAIEIVEPSSPGYSANGDHDGLCESGESCLYSPNFGAYQGEGALATCVFVPNNVTGVTIYGYTSNGI